MPKRKRSYAMRRRRPVKRRRRTYKAKRRKFTGRRKLTRRGGINPKNVIYPNYKRLQAKFALSNVLEGTVPDVSGSNTVVVKSPVDVTNISMSQCFERNLFASGTPVVNPSITALMAAYSQYRIKGIRGKIYLTNLTDITSDSNLECVLDTGIDGNPPGPTYTKSVNDTLMMGGGKVLIVPSSTGSDNRRIMSFGRSNIGATVADDPFYDWRNVSTQNTKQRVAWMRCEIKSQNPTVQVKVHARLVLWVDYEFRDPIPITVGNNDPEDVV